MEIFKAIFVSVFVTAFVFGSVAFAVVYSEKQQQTEAANIAALEEAMLVVALSSDNAEIAAYMSIAKEKANQLDIPLSTCRKIVEAAKKRKATKISIVNFSHSMQSIIKVSFN